MDETLASLLDERAAPAPPTTTQKRILEAALELFAEEGFDRTTTRAVATRAGVTEKTLFAHFGNKRRLFARTVYPALLELMQPLVFGTLKGVLSADAPLGFGERLEAIVRDRIAFVRERPEAFKLIAQELLLRAEFREPFIRFWQRQILPDVGPILNAARERGELRDLPDHAVLRTMLSVVIGYAVQRTILAPDLERDDDAEVAALVDVLLHGLAEKEDRGA